MTYLPHFVRDAIRYVEHMGRTEWLIVAAVAALLGIFLLRGYGSRTDY